VSAEKALSGYGVVLDPKTHAVDVAATQRLRATTKSNQNAQAGKGRL